ncbi:nuclear transport factor 2 family protein [Armatimonas rosea]|uniref:Ketosteroid isomerase-like protein n=1 Tax=Armatimonas rosea TaxID=685828 RepID=A0A7W9SMY0_ARMRO|nr:nuclear transport factor 2 family protein [Armatimonas rosea]MBB6048923.1 ketosteroid isomerase-like protein [Armatimonas rosea]
MRTTLLFCAALVAPAPVFAQQAPAQKTPTRAEAIAATNEADTKRIDAMVKGDLAALETIFTKDLTYTHSSGKSDTKESLLEAMKTGATKYLAVTLSEKKHQVYGNTVIVTGLTEVKVKAGENEVAFKARFTEVWTRQKGEWRFAAWQTTRLPEAK